MFRKILYLLLLSTSVGFAQQGLDATCLNTSIPRVNMSDYHEEALDNYVVCKDQKVTIPANFDVAYLKETTSYTIEQIPYQELYPYNQGTEIPFQNDDQRSTTDIDLPFNFCFFGAQWNKISVHSNGWLNFTNGNNHKGNPALNDPQYPLPTAQSGYTNGVHGINKHTHWNNNNGTQSATTNPSGSINYAVYGTYPCRVFVVSWYNMPSYQLTPTECANIPKNQQSNQILLYETTNVIEVLVKNHNGCPLTAPAGNALIGINNATGTVAYTPPGRNTVIFDTEREAWRFGPNGAPLWEARWYVDNNLVSTSPSPIDVVIDKRKEVRVELLVNTCGDEVKDWYEIVLRPAIELDNLELERQIVCDKNQNTFDLSTMATMIINNQSGVNPAQMNFLYYNTEEDALNRVKNITSPKQFPIVEGSQDVYIRVESEIAGCFEIIPVTIIKAPVEVSPKADVNQCDEYILPSLPANESYLKVERLDEDGKFVVQTLPEQPSVGKKYDVAGIYRVYVMKTNEYGCQDIKSFIMFVENCKYPKGISPNGDGDNDYLDLVYNNVVELKIYNRYGKLVFSHGKGYKRQWNGQDNSGKQLPSGTYFLNVKTKDYEYQDWIQLMYETK